MNTLPAPNVRRDTYRLLARRAARSADPSPRRPAPRAVPPAAPAPGPSHADAEASQGAGKASHGAEKASRAQSKASREYAPQSLYWAADVHIRCFGRFELSRQGVTVQKWRRRSAERVLKFLLVNGRRAHRDVLLDLLWPDVPYASSIQGLRVTLHALRQAIAQLAPDGEPLDLIRAEGDTYVLSTRGLWIDSDAFDEHYAAGLHFERRCQFEAAEREYTAAEALYRDEFLVEDLYEDWTVMRREELKDKYLLILTRLAQWSMAAMDLDGCIRRSHALLAKEPCREDAYLRLMQCYARLGQRGSALRWYQICERTLQQELDVAPADETRRLYREIAQVSA